MAELRVIEEFGQQLHDHALIEVMREREDWYASELCRRLGYRDGSLYGWLARMERLGKVESAWEDEHAPYPRRRVYKAASR